MPRYRLSWYTIRVVLLVLVLLAASTRSCALWGGQ